MTADQMIDLMVARLVRDRGGAKHRWRQRIGAVKLYPRETHAHCNWSVNPTGSFSEIEAVESLADELRLRHPLLTSRAG
ncbi:hypothetical protein [Sphingobium cloacae]|uniref:hypothetical protein n=1 Tax=Sphingobium cloacae TaxID=120107 RepID=UPI00082B8712|nr:hypothetical protein [Sphingobium cloacae]